MTALPCIFLLARLELPRREAAGELHKMMTIYERSDYSMYQHVYRTPAPLLPACEDALY